MTQFLVTVERGESCLMNKKKRKTDESAAA